MKKLTKIPRTPVVLALLALALYLPGFWWGIPHATAPDRVMSWGTDDETPLRPLAEVHGIFFPKHDRNLGYPLMHPFTVFAAYSPYLAYLWLTGELGTMSATYPYGLADPVGTLKMLTLIVRLVSVFMGMGIVVAAYDAGWALWDRRTGILTALLVMVSFPMFYYSRTGNVDVPMLFFTALALAVFARSIAGGFTLRRAAWLGVFAGLAVGTKEPSFASLLPLPFVLLPLHWANTRTTGDVSSWAFWKVPLTALLAAFLAFGMGSGLFVDPGRYFAHVEFAMQRIQDATGGKLAFARTFPETLQGTFQLAKALASTLTNAMTLPGLLLAGLGVVLALRREPLASTFSLPAIMVLLALFWSARIAHLRYLMPVAFTLAFFAARAVLYAWESRQWIVRAAFVLAVIWVIGTNLLRGADLTYVMINDSRYAAAAWLEEQTRPGDRVEYFGASQKLPALKASVVTGRAVAYFGGFLPVRNSEDDVQEIVRGWDERRPKFALIIPDHTSPPGIPHSLSCPPQIYEGLLNGRLGYRHAAYFKTPPLFPWVGRPPLDYPTVNPPIHIFVRATQSEEEDSAR